jgi:hypothetical protein
VTLAGARTMPTNRAAVPAIAGASILVPEISYLQIAAAALQLDYGDRGRASAVTSSVFNCPASLRCDMTAIIFPSGR